MTDDTVRVTARHRRRGEFSVTVGSDRVLRAVEMAGKDATRRGMLSMLARQAGGVSMTESGELMGRPLGEFEPEIMTRGFSVDLSELEGVLGQADD